MSRRTVAIPIDSLGMSDASLKKVSRYVDVTRSALLFGDRALLSRYVEVLATGLQWPWFLQPLVAVRW
jgi:putative ATP-dependent endonuclease of the OLD family